MYGIAARSATERAASCKGPAPDHDVAVPRCDADGLELGRDGLGDLLPHLLRRGPDPSRRRYMLKMAGRASPRADSADRSMSAVVPAL